MTLTVDIWDKISPINGRDAAFLSNHFKVQNGNDDRVLISYNGVVSRIEYLDDYFFSHDEKAYMREAIAHGLSRDQAIAQTWLKKAEDQDQEMRANDSINLRLDALESENKLLRGCVMELAEELYGGDF